MSDSTADRDPIEMLAASFLARFRDGERPSVEEYAAKYPDLADEIRELLPALVMLEQEKSVAGEATGTGGFPAAATAGPSPQQLGDYLILREIGRGGMGVVYESVQQSLGRHVALKVLPHQALAGSEQLVRFRLEARAAARLHHTNIVPVFGVGECDGVNYYAMQFIQGQGLDVVIDALRSLRKGKGPVVEARKGEPSLNGDDRPLTAVLTQALLTGRFAAPRPELGPTVTTTDADEPDSATAPPGPASNLASGSPPSDVGHSSELSSDQAGAAYYRSVARVGIQVAEALAHAHGQGIIHRDIKPSNLLLDAKGTVWVTDFGLAKAEGGEGLTNTGDILGTLRYMAPERFDGWSDPRSDVYALGATLYELLTLRPTFEESNRVKLIEQVLNDGPKPPRKLDRRIPRDLETIVLKALVKEPGQRYTTAEQMAEDLRRFADDRPILARRITPAERAWRWSKRNPALAGLMATVATLLVVVTLGATLSAFRFRSMSRALESNLYFSDIALAHRELSMDNLWRAQKLLDDCPPGLRQWEWYCLERQCRLDPVTFPAKDQVRSVAFSPDGDRLACAAGDRKVKILNSQTGAVVQTLDAQTDVVNSVAFHPGGNHLAAAGADGEVKVWDLTTAEVVFRCPVFGGMSNGTAYLVAFSPDGKCLAAGSDGELKVWDWRDRHRAPLLTLPGHEKNAINIAFRPDGRRLASGSWNGAVMIWDAETGKLLHTLSGHRQPVSALAFSPDGRRLVSASYDRHLIVWDATTGQLLDSLRGHDGLIFGVAFSPDGSRLASVGEDKTVLLWESATWREVLSLRGHTDMCQSVAFSPGGRRLATAGRDATIRLWDATPLQGNEGQEVLNFSQQDGEVWTMAISPDGHRVASAGLAAGFDMPVKVWDARSGLVSATFTGHARVVFSLAWHPDGQRIASSGSNADRTMFVVKVWDAQTGQQAYELPAGRETFALAISPDGHHLVTGGTSQTLDVWDAQTGRAVSTLGAHDRAIRGLVFSPKGQHLASVSADGTVKLWDATHLGEKQVARRTIHARAAQITFNMAFSPDGRRLVAGGEKNTVRIWEVQTGAELKTLEGHSGDVWAAAFSPDPGGRWVASAGQDSAVKVWESDTGKFVRNFRGHVGLVTSLAFSPPDGQLLVSGSRDGTAKVWDLTHLGKKPEE